MYFETNKPNHLTVSAILKKNTEIKGIEKIVKHFLLDEFKIH